MEESIVNLNPEQLFQSLMSETENLRQAAVVLKRNQIDGATLLAFEDEDFEELSLTFVSKKALKGYLKKKRGGNSSREIQDTLAVQHEQTLKLVEHIQTQSERMFRQQEKLFESVLASNQKSQELMIEAIKAITSLVLGGKEKLSPPEPVTFIVHPMSTEVKLEITHRKSTQKLQTTSENPIDLASFPDGVFDVVPFSLLGKESSIPLSPFTIQKTGILLEPSFVDLGLSQVVASFLYEDTPFDQAHVSGTFQPVSGSKMKVNKETSSDGTSRFTLPEGKLSIQAQKVYKGKKVVLDSSMEIPKPKKVSNPEEMKKVEKILNTVNSNASIILNGINCTGSVAILGDVSGSMSSDDNIEKLRNTYSKLWQSSKKNLSQKIG